MNDMPPQPNKQLGLLDLSVDLSVPEVYSGTEFTLYLHVKNPFSRPVWIKSVELSLPTQLSVQEPKEQIKKRLGDRDTDEEFTRNLIRERESEIKQLRRSILNDSLDDNDRENVQARLKELEDRTRADLASLSGGLVVESSGESKVFLNDPRAVNIILRPSGSSAVHVNNYQGFIETERATNKLTSSWCRTTAWQHRRMDDPPGKSQNPIFYSG